MLAATRSGASTIAGRVSAQYMKRSSSAFNVATVLPIPITAKILQRRVSVSWKMRSW